MSTDAITRMENLLERKFSEEETARLRRIRDVLHLRNGDALWDILTAMEYQRTYYEELPGKIAGASAEILRGIEDAAEKEVAHAQSRLTESVVEHAKKLSVKINYASLWPAAIATLICVLTYGSLLLWAGFCIGAGQGHSPIMLLRMPSGLLIGGLCLATGLFFGFFVAREYAGGEKGWYKRLLLALAFLIAGGVIFSLAL